MFGFCPISGPLTGSSVFAGGRRDLNDLFDGRGEEIGRFSMEHDTLSQQDFSPVTVETVDENLGTRTVLH